MSGFALLYPTYKLYPEDGHAPHLATGGPSAVHKIVMKVAV